VSGGPGGAFVASLLAGRAAETDCLLAVNRMTAGGLRERVACLSGDLASRGVGAGSVVALQLPPSFTYVAALMAVWELEAQVVLLDHRLPAAERARCLSVHRPGFIVGAADAAARPGTFREELPLSIERLAGRPEAAGGVALVQFTSGSTGVPKVIGRTFGSLAAELARWTALEGTVTSDDRVLLLSSHVHTLGLVAGILHTLRSGAALLWSQTVQPHHVLDAASRLAATAIYGVPFHYELLASTAAGGPLPGLRVAISGGEPLRPETYRRFEERYGVRIGQAYGMTEVGMIAADLVGCFPLTAGPVAEGLEVEVAGGEVRVRVDRSPYLRPLDPSPYRDGWLRTFDRGAQDPATGVLTVSGRTDSMVAVGGLKVDLLEVETVLREHPAVDDAVVLLDEVIEAYVATREPPAPDLLTWCGDRLAPHKVPKRFFLGPTLPTTATGKTLRSRTELLRALS
jgi:3-hydroxy-4-methylanthranilate adenylyltransferase